MELDSSAFSATGSGCALAQEALFMRYEAKILELQRQIDKLSSDLYDKKKQLDRVTHYLESLLKNISEGLILISHTGMITTYNTAAEKILGIKQKEVLFTNFSETFLDNTFGFSMSYALKKLDSAEIHVTKYLYKGLYEKELEISKSAVCTRARTHRGIILVLRDITRLRQEIRKEQQNKRMQELGQLAATVAHEVRNPLGGIEGFASLLQSDLKYRIPA